MIWLLIILTLAVVVSPLMMMKSSPRQQQISDCRQAARSLSINVNLQPRPDARESENSLVATLYWLPWQSDRRPEPWVLHCCSNRGLESPWPKWYWLPSRAGSEWHDVLDETLSQLPSGASAVVLNSVGVGITWDERNDASTVSILHSCIERLRKKGEEISL